jgi:thiol:disulfide interchange protein DsbC
LKKFICLAGAVALAASTLAAHAETAQETAVRRLLQPRLSDTIDSVTRTPYLGLFEVRTGTEIVYTDANARYLLNGSIVDARTSHDYTRERQEVLSRIAFADLPLDAALKQVKGDGKRRIAIFEDPNCGYCKHLRETLKAMDNVTVYTFMYNILSPESATISRNIWCTANAPQAWDDWMLAGKAAPDAPASCKAPNDQVLAFGQKIRINATPTLFFADGTRVAGAMDAKSLESRLSMVKVAR